MELDTSVFKKLAHNDTGAAVGHQGGIVIPKDIAEFFPPLPQVESSASPTVDVRLSAELFVDGLRVAMVETRFQHQTWGGKRSPERRLTDNLGQIRNLASEGDFIIFTKDLSDDSYIQIHLVRKATQAFNEMTRKVGATRWGLVNPDEPPVSLSQFRQAEADLQATIGLPASAFGGVRTSTPVTAMRKARDRAFRNLVLEQYEFRCAFTGRKFISPLSSKTIGLDAAHVVPVQADGSDHPGNGMPLTKDLHWAFDRGLIGVDPARRILVPSSVAALPGNEFLKDLHQSPINEAKDVGLRVLDDALDWHRKNVMLR